MEDKIKGVDICVLKSHCYIIRSDLGCYMKAKDFNKGSDLSIHALHPSCQHGDHYLADEKGFYIIKGDECRRVTDLSEDTDSAVFKLSGQLKGGQHYLAAKGKFYIIQEITANGEKIKKYRITTALSKDPSSTESQNINGSYKDGLYYWGDKNHFYFLKPTEWGFEYYKGKDLNKDECTDALSVHPDVLNFLPDGLSKTNGPAFSKWVKIKYVSNDSLTPVKWHKKVTKKVGYNKEKLSQITKHWKIETLGRISAGTLAGLIADAQFSLLGLYERSRVYTEKEMWTEETEEEEQLSFDLKPNECLYVWQYQLGFGSEPVLFWRDLKITNKPNPPSEVPLLLANSPVPQSPQEKRLTSSRSL